MTKQALPAVSLLTSETIEEFKTQDKVVVIAYFGADDKKSNTTFTEIADKLRDDYLFGAVNDEELAKTEGVKQPGVVVYKSFDEGKDVYDGKFDKDAITKFAKDSATPLVGEVGPETYAGYMAVRMIQQLQHLHVHKTDQSLRRNSHWGTSSQKPKKSEQNWRRL